MLDAGKGIDCKTARLHDCKTFRCYPQIHCGIILPCHLSLVSCHYFKTAELQNFPIPDFHNTDKNLSVRKQRISVFWQYKHTFHAG